MILVAMSRHYGGEPLAVAHLDHVVGDLDHAVGGRVVRQGRRSEIHQHMPGAVGIGEAQKEGVAESDLVASDGEAARLHDRAPNTPARARWRAARRLVPSSRS